MPATQVEGELRTIAIKDLVFDDQNPRRDVGDLSELRDSIRSLGVLEPIVVRPQNGHFSVIAGRRRWAAAREAGLEQIPAIVTGLSDEDAAAASLVENLQRKDLTPLEEAQGYRDWLELTKRPQTELAKAVGKAPSTIANALRLLEAPKPVQEALASGQITAAHAKTALELRSPSLASSLKFKPGQTVDELHDQVRRVNEEYDTKGEGAKTVLREALAAAKTKYPNATITWKAGAYDVVSLIATLGKPPAQIVGAFGPGTYPQVTLEKHDKVCTCRAYELDARTSWSGQRKVVTELRRVCIDKKGYAAAKPKQKKATRAKTAQTSAPKPLTPAQLKKQQERDRKAVDAAVKRALEVPRAGRTNYAAAFKKLAITTIPADIARAMVAIEQILFQGGPDDECLAIWQRLKDMPAKKVSQLAGAQLAQLLERETSYGTADEVKASLLEYFGVKVKAAKPKKAAKR